MWFIELFAAGLPFYRASEDAGISYLFDREAAALYLEGWAQERLAK
jgi:hypothetical protein